MDTRWEVTVSLQSLVEIHALERHTFPAPTPNTFFKLLYWGQLCSSESWGPSPHGSLLCFSKSSPRLEWMSWYRRLHCVLSPKIYVASLISGKLRRPQPHHVSLPLCSCRESLLAKAKQTHKKFLAWNHTQLCSISSRNRCQSSSTWDYGIMQASQITSFCGNKGSSKLLTIT